MPAQYNEVSHKPAGHYTFWKLGTRWPYYSTYYSCLNFSEKYSTLALSLCWVLENQELDDRESFHCGNPDMFRASTEWFFIAFICILSVIGRSPFVLIITKWFPSLQHADAVTLFHRDVYYKIETTLTCRGVIAACSCAVWPVVYRLQRLWLYACE